MVLDLSRPTLVLSAGMRRSASTWLYNALRLMLEDQHPVREELACGWIGDWDTLKSARCILVKLHDPHPALIAHASMVVYSFRDIRDVLASLQRKFDMTPTVELADRLIEEDAFWTARAQYVMRYETMVDDPRAELVRLQQRVGLPAVDLDALAMALQGLRFEASADSEKRYHPTNLLHADHVTDGRHGSWQGQLDPGLVSSLQTRHRDWFVRHGYPVSD